jgi:pyruvate ferredoxin oxidoreductase alpha subunit/2-oxoisovalerate ferredoxin oxidoreductase alpha subunit
VTKILDTGNTACALAVKAAGPDFIAAYPITPQTTISEKLADYAAKGEIRGKYLAVESEHSVMAAVAAAATGARTFTATSSQGLLYMHEILHYAAGGRLPVVMANVNRAVAAPWCLYVDHQDAVAQRDTGWLQFHCASHQEIYDTIFLAYKVAEKLEIPTIVNYDGFLLSHSMLPFETVEQDLIDRFLPPRQPVWRLHPQWGGTFGNVSGADEYAAYRHKLAADILTALPLIEAEIKEYAALTGRPQPGLIQASGPADAEVFILSMGSMAAETELAAAELSRQGISASALKLRVYRPFPAAALAELLPAGCRLLALDRNLAYGHNGGALLMEAKAALYGSGKNIAVSGAAVGIGGQDLPVSALLETIHGLLEVAR